MSWTKLSPKLLKSVYRIFLSPSHKINGLNLVRLAERNPGGWMREGTVRPNSWLFGRAVVVVAVRRDVNERPLQTKRFGLRFFRAAKPVITPNVFQLIAMNIAGARSAAMRNCERQIAWGYRHSDRLFDRMRARLYASERGMVWPG